MPVGAVVIPAATWGRPTAFWQCVEDLERPPGWRLPAKTARGSSVAANRNLLAHWILEEGYDWAFWLDDDLEFRPNTLLRLFDHADPVRAPVVVALSRRRHPPFEALWMDWHPEGGMIWVDPHDPAQGLQRLAGATSGAMLTHRSALAAVGGPWWTLGQFARDEWQDDIWFCTRLAQLGIPLYGDPTVCVGHTTDMTVWPAWHEGCWQTVLARGTVPFAMTPARPVTESPIMGRRS